MTDSTMTDLTCPYCGSSLTVLAEAGLGDIVCDNRLCRAEWGSDGCATEPSRLPRSNRILRPTV